MINKKIKVIATIGPKTANKKILEILYSNGMSVARLNGSHNTLEWHSKTIALIKKTLPDVPILLDIPGRKIRTANLKQEPKFKVSDESAWNIGLACGGEIAIFLEQIND